MSEKIKGRFQIVDEQDNIVFMHALKEGEYDRLIRLLELLPDEQAVDDVIKSLEAPKREVASQIAQKISKAKNFEEVLTDALIVLPKAELKEITHRIDRLKFSRKPDCLIIRADEKTWRVPL